jgi:predicted nuclease of predicted toxin-antitoxin system
VKLLLESHVSVAVVRVLLRRCPGLKTIHHRDWKGGALLNAPDPDLLAEAGREELTLVTHDLKTIPSLLRQMAEVGEHHAGVVLIDDATISQSDVGAIAAALADLWRAHGKEDWQDRCVFLRRHG